MKKLLSGAFINLSFFAIYLYGIEKIAFASPQDAPKKDATSAPKENNIPDQAKRLGITEIKKSMKFETIESKKYKGETYDIVIDEKEAEKAGLSPEEIKKSLEKAMESRSDRKEDGKITVEIQDDQEKKSQDSSEKNTEKKETRKKFVAKIQKTKHPESPHQDSLKPGEKKFNMGDGRSLKITTEGACETQNKALLESVKFDNPA